MSTGSDWISQHDLLRTDYAMLALTCTVFVGRLGVQAWRRKRIEVQDILLYIAFLAYLAFTILYIYITPIFFKVQALEAGRIVPWPAFAADLRLASEVMWQSGIEYWTCLWFVKFSLLALYRKLLVGMPKTYLWVWKGTLSFCIVVSKGLRSQHMRRNQLTIFRPGLPASSPVLVWHAMTPKPFSRKANSACRWVRPGGRLQTFTMHTLWTRLRI
jgi:hypothetical protein